MTDAPAAASGARLERCPNCTAKLPATPVSICPYCVFPLGVEKADQAEGSESPNRARILRVREHDRFATVEATQPPESLEFQLGGKSIFWSRIALFTAVVLVGLGAALAGAALLTHWLTWLGLIGVAFAAWLFLRGAAARKQAVSQPMLKRPGLIVDRRSETLIHGWSGQTIYYFEIEFEDGARAEFRYPGRGSQQDPYVNNLPGVAFTRGQDLLIFKHIRV